MLRSMKTKTTPPCKCERLSFPHRRAWQCDAFEDEALSFHGGNLGCADEDEYNADCRERARDCNAAMRGI